MEKMQATLYFKSSPSKVKKFLEKVETLCCPKEMVERYLMNSPYAELVLDTKHSHINSFDTINYVVTNLVKLGAKNELDLKVWHTIYLDDYIRDCCKFEYVL